MEIRIFLAAWPGMAEPSEHSDASNRWWPTTAVRGVAVKAVSRRRRWPQASLYCGSPHSQNRRRGSMSWLRNFVVADAFVTEKQDWQVEHLNITGTEKRRLWEFGAPDVRRCTCR